MKKMFALLLAAVMMLSVLTACGSGDTQEETTGDTATEESSEVSLNAVMKSLVTVGITRRTVCGRMMVNIVCT